MTKSQLVDAIAAKAPHVPRQTIEAIVNAVFDSMVEALRDGGRIEVRGFGSLGVKVRPARNGRNPKTGQQVSVPERRTPTFTCGKELRARLNPARELSGAASSSVQRAGSDPAAKLATAAASAEPGGTAMSLSVPPPPSERAQRPDVR